MKSKPNIRNRYIFFFDVVFMVFSVLGAYALRLDMGPLFLLLPEICILDDCSFVGDQDRGVLCVRHVQAYVGVCQYKRIAINHWRSDHCFCVGLWCNGLYLDPESLQWFPTLGIDH